MSTEKFVGKDKDGNEVSYYIKRPSAKDYSDANIYANATAAQIINSKTVDGKPGFLLRSQVKSYLQNLGIWTDEQENELIRITKEIVNCENQLARGGIKKSEAKNISFRLIDLRREQLELLSKINEMDNITLEAQRENAQFDSLVSLCVLNSEGNREFSSVDDYKERAVEQPWYFDAAQNLAGVIYGRVDEVSVKKKQPEYKFLSRFGYVDEKLRLVDNNGRLIDRDGKLINEDGYYIDENGNRVDKDGNRVEVDVEKAVETAEFLDD